MTQNYQGSEAGVRDLLAALAAHCIGKKSQTFDLGPLLIMVSDYGSCDTSAITRPGTAPNRLLGGTPERQPRLQAGRDSE